MLSNPVLPKTFSHFNLILGSVPLLLRSAFCRSMIHSEVASFSLPEYDTLRSSQFQLLKEGFQQKLVRTVFVKRKTVPPYFK